MARVRLSINQFLGVVKRAIDELPPEFQRRLENVVVDVLDLPSRKDLELTDADADRDELLGLFEGVSLLDQAEGVAHPNRIKLFRRNLEVASADREDLVANIQETVVHEIAHHFGMSEEDLAPFELAMEEKRRRRLGDPP